MQKNSTPPSRSSPGRKGSKRCRGLHDQGVSLVVQPEFEASLEVARQALMHLDVPMDQIQQYTDEVREELYRPLYKDWQKTKD